MTPRLVRTATVFLIAVALIYLATLAVAARVAGAFDRSSTVHIEREIQRIRAKIGSIESALDASNNHVAGALQRSAVLTRPQLFRLLHDEVHHLPRRGMRIVG